MLSWEKHSAKQTVFLETGLLLKKKKKKERSSFNSTDMYVHLILISDIVLFIKKPFCMVK